MNPPTLKSFPLALPVAALALGLAVLQPARAQTFTTDRPLQTARWGHTATLLPNGLVLIAGGLFDNDYGTGQIMRATASCELYNPATGSSTPTGAMSDAHQSHTATLLPNGRVLVAAGRKDNGYIFTKAELYDPGTGTWTDTGSLNTPRSSFTATLLPGGQVLVVGGYNGGGTHNGDEASAELYDPASETWTETTAMNYFTDSQIAILLPNGTVLVAGGGDGSGGGVTNANVFNPADQTWTNVAPMSTGRGGHAAALLQNGLVLVAGGEFGNTAEIYDPATGVWTDTGALNEGRRYPTFTLLADGQVLAIGGFPGQTTTELYDPNTAVWTIAATLHVGRTFHTATLVSGGQVVVTGGDVTDYNGPPLAAVETYNQGTLVDAALNATMLVWTSGGDASWFAETTDTHDTVSATQSGAIANNQQTWLQTTVTGPGTVTFWWQVSSESGADFLAFELDGTRLDEISGTGQDWVQQTYSIASGSHTLRWLYAKDSSISAGFDAGWLDEVVFTATTSGGPPSPGVWTLTGAMAAGRSGHTATLLSDGQVLVAGGTDQSLHTYDSAELYDPATGWWTGTRSMAEARQAFTATLLPNGKVLVAGGTPNFASYLATAELYDPGTGTWSATGTMHNPRCEHTATLLPDGKVLVAGGINASPYPSNVLTSSELYDPATERWTTSGPMTVGRYNHAVTLLPDGMVQVVGGSSADFQGRTGTTEIYNPATGIWTPSGYLPDQLVTPTATLLSTGRILVAGGESATPSPFAYLSDQAFATWMAADTMKGIHDGHTATLLPNGLVLVAGQSYPTSLFVDDSAELYEPVSAIWTLAAGMQVPRRNHTATLLLNGLVLVVGGGGNSGVLASAELYEAGNYPPFIVITSTSMTGGAFQFTWSYSPGSTHVVLSSSDLALPIADWTELGNATETSPGHFQFTDPDAVNYPQRFYRVRSP
ncbi:MAG: hypothetical protein NTW21_15820 [Verrucomicrobia bacterium]|nr:hypothetical protein [Verrucomicrobiota bacterium]